MDDHRSTLTVDSNTVASNPGRLSIQRLRWIRYRPLWPLIWASLFLVSVLLTVLLHWGYGILAALSLASNLFYWKRLKEHFLVGCANPAVIVGVAPTLIAVYTDLRSGYDSPKCPAIKVIQTRLPKPQSGQHKPGDKILTVSLYYGPSGKDRWMGFDPIPAALVSNDKAAIAVRKSEISEEWETLDVWLAKVETPETPGLYAFEQGKDVPQEETQEPAEKPNSSSKSPWSEAEE